MLATVVFLGTTHFLNVFAVICRYMNVEPLLSASLKRDTSQKVQNKSKGSSSIYLVNQLDIVLNCG